MPKVKKRWNPGDDGLPVKEKPKTADSVPDAFVADKPGGLSVPETPSVPADVVDDDDGGIAPNELEKLAKSARAFSNAIRDRALASFADLTSDDLTSLVTGEITTQQLIDKYGLTDDVTFQEEASNLAQVANSINLSIQKKGVQALAIRDRRASFELVEEAAKTAKAATQAGDAVQESQHAQNMSDLRSKIREAIKRKKGAEVVIQEGQATKRESKAGIYEGMKQRRENVQAREPGKDDR